MAYDKKKTLGNKRPSRPIRGGVPRKRAPTTKSKPKIQPMPDRDVMRPMMTPEQMKAMAAKMRARMGGLPRRKPTKKAAAKKR